MTTFNDWLYLRQTQFDPDDLNKREKDLAELAWKAAQQDACGASVSDKPASGAQNEIHAPQNEWKATIDHELVTMGCTADSFNSPKEALNALIAWNITVATDAMLDKGNL